MAEKSKKVRGEGKVTATVKENILAVFTRLGGTAAMARWARENETEFYRMYAKLLPLQLTGANDKPITFGVTIIPPE